MSEATITPILVNPWARPRKGPVQESVPLPGLGVDITLRSLDTLLTSAASNEANGLIAEFVGSDESEEPPKLFLAPDGEEYELNEALVRDLCYLRWMQVADRRFDFSWWLGVALCCPEEYSELNQVAQRVNAKWEKLHRGNSRKPIGSTSDSSAQ